MDAGDKMQLPPSSQSFWLDSTAKTDYPALEEDIQVDAAIIGGGLVGITTAWLLKKEGLKVAVLEADRICQGTTGHSTAKITSQHNLIYEQIYTKFGRELAGQYADANETAVKVMAELIKEHNIDCDFQWKPAYVYTLQDKYVEKIEKEAETAALLGIKADYLEKLELPFSVKAAVRFADQAQFHPRKYVLALAQLIPGAGCQIYEETAVTGLEEGRRHTIQTSIGKKIRAERVINASHFPIHDGLGFFFGRMYADRSYILGVITPDKLPEGMYVSAESPGRSLRTQKYKGGEMLLVAGEDHKTAQGVTEDIHYRNLRDFAAANFTISAIPYRWSAQDYTTADNVPYIGQVRSGAENLYLATGFRKWGISTSTVSALLLRDLIVKGKSPWQDIYSPQRKITPAAVGQLVLQNLDVAKELIAGKLKSPATESIKEGEGKVIAIEGHKLGAHRAETGQLHLVDVTCTHLGCELKWNSAEKTWDCPCHGSRFSYEGDVVDGPALKPLQHLPEGSNVIDPDII